MVGTIDHKAVYAASLEAKQTTLMPQVVVHAAKDVLSSFVGSTMCVYSGAPFDVVKVRMQARPDAFSGPIQCLMLTWRMEGATALWKGSVPALVGAMSENAVAFAVNEQLKRFVNTTRRPPETPWESFTLPFCTGGFTGIFTSVALCPSDVIKCKVQVSRENLKEGEKAMNATEMTRHVLRTQGVRGLFVGLGAQFARDIPFYAFFFGTYDLSVWLLKKHTDAPAELSYLVAGGLAGVAGWAAVMPLDVAKSIIQTAAKPKPLLPTMMEVVKDRGPGALYSGFGVAVIRAFPANAALFLGYEIVRELLGE